MKPNGAVLWEGISRIDGKTPIVCIITGLASASSNTKTGAMLQTYIIRSDLSPVEAMTTRADVGICGGCVHRKQANGARSCYVNVGQGPRAVFDAYRRGVYGEVVPMMALQHIGDGRTIRLGTYGDPAAVPFDVWSSLLTHAAGHTGYTHQWRREDFRPFARFIQASCETEGDVARAHRIGFAGTFRVLPIGAALPERAMLCPASEEAGKRTTCADCLVCSGSRDVVIHAHGTGRKHYLPVL
jgi:hypothetical protein